MSARLGDDEPAGARRAHVAVLRPGAGETAGVHASPFDVVALVTSAGGLTALNQVLLPLPENFGAAIVIVQHLGGPGSRLVQILRRRSPLPVDWIADRDTLRPGRVYVCPPQHLLEVMPDAECSIRPMEPDHKLRPIDFFLTSLADSYGPRAMVVVLTGMGHDSAAGSQAVSQADGTVLVQSPDSAEHPVMPSSVIESGVADLVVPLPELGQVIADVIAGGVMPRTLSERAAAERLFAGDGEVPALLREMDWARTPFGLAGQWPAVLRTAIRTVLDSPLAMCLLWGTDHLQLYNDEYRMLMGDKHPVGLGQPCRDCWPEVWHLNEPIFARVWLGEAVALHDALFPITRYGTLENAWFDLSYIPVRDNDGEVAGALCVVVETTAEVLSRRRLNTLHTLTTATSGSATRAGAFQLALDALAANDLDIPFAIGYQLDVQGARAQLVGAAGVKPGGPMAPYTIEVASSGSWPLQSVVPIAEPVVVDHVSTRFRGVVVGPEGQQPSSALLLPLRNSGDSQLAGILILGVSALLPFDQSYRDFLILVGAQTAAALAEADSRYRERQRQQRLAELDLAKTEFYSNISHEFRTPLTLLLSPLDELARRRGEIPADLADEMEVAARNARRLLNLVDTLLDFSRLEAGRLRADLQPTDLAALTTDIASAFRSAAERAGLRLRVDCPQLPVPVWVDRDMWEKVVSNLLSNALKHTFQGEIVVELRHLTQHAELIVRDTGVGIPDDQIPHIFERFHRVRDARARSHEGSGIGLSLVQELVRQHYGRIRVRSQQDEGTVFTVWIPVSPPHRPRQQAEPDDAGQDAARAPTASALATVASRWETGEAGLERPADVLDAPAGEVIGDALRPQVAGAHVLVVDDNADMRAYLARLLGEHWNVSTAKDGEEALHLTRRLRPDLVLADVMMPRFDGLALLHAIRADHRLAGTLVMLVTARAGQDAAVEGLLAGADDYITKPFSARELVARVAGQIALARVRRTATLPDTRERFQALAEASADMVWTTDAQGVMTEDSPSWRAFTGQKLDEWLGLGWIDVVHPEDRGYARRQWQEAVDSHTPVNTRFRLWHAPTRTWRYTQVRAIPLHHDDGTVRGWMGMNIDLTGGPDPS
jgi:PAS domain S-box-containing protein